MTQKRYTEIPKRQKCINKEEPYIGGAEDIIDDGINGFLVPDGKKKDYADALRRIMSNDDLLAKMSAAAYVKVQQFASERIAKQWAELICSITK